MNEKTKNLKEAGGIAKKAREMLGADSVEGRIAYDVIILLSAYQQIQGNEARELISPQIQDLESDLEKHIEKAKQVVRENPDLLDELYVLACI